MKGVISELQWELDLLGADDCPAALGLDAAHMGKRRRVAIAHAGAMGHLIEAIPGGDRPDLDGLEQDVELRVQAHEITRIDSVIRGRTPFPDGARRTASERNDYFFNRVHMVS